MSNNDASVDYESVVQRHEALLRDIAKSAAITAAQIYGALGDSPRSATALRLALCGEDE
jgi:hypothetical protein